MRWMSEAQQNRRGASRRLSEAQQNRRGASRRLLLPVCADVHGGGLLPVWADALGGGLLDRAGVHGENKPKLPVRAGALGGGLLGRADARGEPKVPWLVALGGTRGKTKPSETGSIIRKEQPVRSPRCTRYGATG